jgi:hypothetical protein
LDEYLIITVAGEELLSILSPTANHESASTANGNTIDSGTTYHLFLFNPLRYANSMENHR